MCMTTTRLSTLRRELGAHVPGRGKRYPIELKARLVAFARARRSEGGSWATIADELGLTFETVRRWCVGNSPTTKRTAMRAVEIVADAAPHALAVVSPSGLRVEGITIDDAVALLRALG
jgi:transposase